MGRVNRSSSFPGNTADHRPKARSGRYRSRNIVEAVSKFKFACSRRPVLRSPDRIGTEGGRLVASAATNFETALVPDGSRFDRWMCVVRQAVAVREQRLTGRVALISRGAQFTRPCPRKFSRRLVVAK